MTQPQIVPLNKNAHAKIKVKNASNFPQAAEQHLIPVVIQEFVPVSSSFPIIFVRETQESEEFVAVALMGLKQGENLYVSQEQYDEIYAPAALRNAPFSISSDEKQENFFVCIDENSPLVGEEEGEALFDENGTETEYLTKRRDFTGKFVENIQMTKRFVKELQENELLVPNDLSVRVDGGETYALNGIFRVDEAKLNEMSDEKFADFRKRGMLPVIYAHLNSLQQVQRLAKRKTPESK